MFKQDTMSRLAVALTRVISVPCIFCLPLLEELLPLPLLYEQPLQRPRLKQASIAIAVVAGPIAVTVSIYQYLPYMLDG